jgi:hypothetical protein
MRNGHPTPKDESSRVRSRSITDTSPAELLVKAPTKVSRVLAYLLVPCNSLNLNGKRHRRSDSDQQQPANRGLTFMIDFKCRWKAAQATAGLKKALTDLDSGPFAVAMNLVLLVLATLILIEVALRG